MASRNEDIVEEVDDDVLMQDAEDDDVPLRGSRRASRVGKSYIVSDDSDDADNVKQPAKSNGSARPMKMSHVEIRVPQKQTTITSYFTTPSGNAPRVLLNADVNSSRSKKTSAKGNEKAKAKAAPPSKGRTKARTVVLDDESDFEPEPEPENSENEADDDYEGEGESENDEPESEPEYETSDDDVQPKFKKQGTKIVKPTGSARKGASAPMGIGYKETTVPKDASGKKIKMPRYKCKELPHGLRIKPVEADLPPISNLYTMFEDILSRMPDFHKLFGKNKYRKLRVATMCSGTESPILALGMFKKALEKKDIHLDIEHVFSCEIEPYKQAYIERNFKPPILFRDIKELGDEYATTAYGQRVKVPGENVDILIAGTSCVDFSNLNNNQMRLEEGGESGDTFLGMMRWVERHRPLIVIQENVVNCAWSSMRDHWKERQYSAEYYGRFDTKSYYIPHTRLRGYLFALNVQKSTLPNRWISAMDAMKRPAMTTLEAFLLSEDDPRVHQARVELAGDFRSEKASRVVDWEKCQGKHFSERQKQKLGMRRTFTQWEESGGCKVPDNMWTDWFQGQVERVWDLCEINHLSEAVRGFDSMFKSTIWNLSQNVDRNTMGYPNGITQCLTPTMIPYFCPRGGPVIGLECLHLQGLPIDRLLLTRESSKNLLDLAGNAMSSTVVGSAMAVALLLAKDLLPNADDIPRPPKAAVELTAISGVEHLKDASLDLSGVDRLNLKEILRDAAKSARRCKCEGRTGIAPRTVWKCKVCNHCVCNYCGGRPEHNYADLYQPSDRLSPIEFEVGLKRLLPMKLRVDGLTEDLLLKTKNAEKQAAEHISPKDWSVWNSMIKNAVQGCEFRFKNLVRDGVWTAVYESPQGALNFVMDPDQPEWRLYVLCNELDGVNSKRRSFTGLPVARMRVHDAKDIMRGRWDICLPTLYTFSTIIEGVPYKKDRFADKSRNDIPDLLDQNHDDCWEATLGLQTPDHFGRKVWHRLQVTVPEEAKNMLDVDPSGQYRYMPSCGQAKASLHYRIDGPKNAQPMYFYLDQLPVGTGDTDPYVFTADTTRYEYGKKRITFGKLTPSWRQNDKLEPQEVETTVEGCWRRIKGVSLKSSASKDDGTVAYPHKPLKVGLTNEDCAVATMVLTVKVALHNQEESVWPRGKWIEVDSTDRKETFEGIAWVTERVKALGKVTDWTSLDLPTRLCHCERCAPTPPEVFFARLGNKGQFKAFENPEETAPYERALKARPPAVITQIKLEDGYGLLKMGLNVATLIHRALSCLPENYRTSRPEPSWRLVPNYVPEVGLIYRKFTLKSNKLDPSYSQPPNFRIDLRPEQLRSLHWMASREHEDAKPFIEEEVSESLLPEMNWRVEARVQRPHPFSGGVLADEVGYGKTVTTLALIDSSQSKVKLPDDVPGRIPVKASLIVVPNHLTDQWTREVSKFLGPKYYLITIKSAANLKTWSIEDFKKADIIIMSADTLTTKGYLERLHELTATDGPTTMPPVNKKGDKVVFERPQRRFLHWQSQMMKNMAQQVDILKDAGAEAARQNHRRLQADLIEHLKKEESAYIQTKRKKGKAYQAEKDEFAKTGDKRKRSDDEESEENDSDVVTDSSRKKAKTTSSDPWGFNSNAVQRNYEKVKYPTFEMFHFNRLVVDEFTYFHSNIHASVTGLQSSSRWVLSGTPPLDDFLEVKSIATFLGIHLGIDDEGEGKESSQKQMTKDRTNLEEFTGFRENRSPHWHYRRLEIAQQFLDMFVRANVAEIDEIPWEEHIIPVQLPAAEKAIYLELSHYLKALDMKIRRAKRDLSNDRDNRLQKALGESRTAEEALLKRCSHFDIDLTEADEENAVQACEVIVRDRETQLVECRQDIRTLLKDLVALHKEIPKDAYNVKDYFQDWLDHLETSTEDASAYADLKSMVNEALKGTQVVYCDGTVERRAIKVKKYKSVKEQIASEHLKKDESVETRQLWPRHMVEKVESLKNWTTQVRKCVRQELCGRHRSLRYFRVIRDLQKHGLANAAKSNRTNVACPRCKRENLAPDELAILSTCGHVGCIACFTLVARQDECLGKETGCRVAARPSNMVLASSLGIEDAKDGIGRHYGMKLEKLVELIEVKIPKNEKVLVFIQFDDLRKKMVQLFKDHNLNHVDICATPSTKRATVITSFQEGNGRVLVLPVMGEAAAGANLVGANHVIFLSPLLTEGASNYKYESTETQAIGRVRRFGQNKTVHIWRFMTKDTIDFEIFEGRTKITGKEQEKLYYDI